MFVCVVFGFMSTAATTERDGERKRVVQSLMEYYVQMCAVRIWKKNLETNLHQYIVLCNIYETDALKPAVTITDTDKFTPIPSCTDSANNSYVNIMTRSQI